MYITLLVFLAATAAAKLLRGRFSGEVVACSRSFAAFSLSGLCVCAKTGSKIQCEHLKIYEASSLQYYCLMAFPHESGWTVALW